MAIAQTSPLTGPISGALGDVIFANTRYGLMVKRRPLKIKRHSEKLLKVQARLPRLQNLWTELTEAQRTEWRKLAETILNTNRLGVRSSPSGYQLFLKLNLQGLTRWHVPIGLAPLKHNPEPLGAVTLTFTTAPSYRITTDLPPGFGSWVLLYFGSRPFKKYPIRSYRSWTFLGWGNGGMDDFLITPHWTQHLGSCAEGEFVGVKLVNTYYGYWYAHPRIFTAQVTAP